MPEKTYSFGAGPLFQKNYKNHFHPAKELHESFRFFRTKAPEKSIYFMRPDRVGQLWRAVAGREELRLT